jgi:Kef-type K+ transport system membrane component KefB
MEEYILLVLSIIFFISFLNKLISPKLKMPEVTGYVILGVVASALFAPFVGRGVFDEILDSVEIISGFALALIGFSIGVELKISTLKKLGSSIFLIVILETVGTFILVSLVLKLLGFETYSSILLGAVSSATAPAATVSVIRQYKAKGTLTSSILAVVGIDDASALIIYVIAASFAKSLISGTHIEISKILLSVVTSITMAVAIGAISGFLYSVLVKKIRNQDIIETILIAFLLMLLGISELFHISELLTIMTFGAVLANLSELTTRRSEKVTEKFNNILIGAFFITGGAHLDLTVVKSVFWVGLIYFTVRAIGKIAGASLGAILGKASPKVKKHIGFTLLPQVGVALALAIAIKKEFGGVVCKNYDLGLFVFNILLFTTLITELVGPILTKRALIKAGEIKES